jgi:uncharacterized membrane protein
MDKTFLRWSIGYFDESEVIGALWLSKNVDVENSKIYSDYSSAAIVLSGYGMLGDRVQVMSNVTVLPSNGTVYLNRANIDDGVYIGPTYLWNTTSISQDLNLENKIYSNGGCEIYQMTISSTS